MGLFAEPAVVATAAWCSWSEELGRRTVQGHEELRLLEVQTGGHMMAAAQPSPLTTHVLNTCDGVPAVKLELSLHRLDSKLMLWNLLTVETTNEDGRCPGLIRPDAFTDGMYKLRFETARYWERLGHNSFYPYVEVVFTISDAPRKVHIPLLLSPFSYSTYRGS